MVPVGQQRKARSKPAMHPPAVRRRGRLLAAFWSSFTGQAIVAVAMAHIALLPWLSAGLLSPITYALLALSLSCVAIAIIGRRIARSIATLRTALMHFRTAPDAARPPLGNSARTGADSTELVSLQRGLDRMYRRLARREQRLKTAYEEAEREIIASRNLAQQLTRSQRIARIGTWEWERESNNVVCSGDVFRIMGVSGAQVGLRPGAILSMVHEQDPMPFKRWRLRLRRGVVPTGQGVRVLEQNGEVRHVHVLAEPLLDAAGSLTGLAGTIQDATERTQAIQQIHRLAYFDAVTELPNRSRFDSKLAETLERAAREGTSFAIM